MLTRVTATVVCCILMQILCVVSQKKLQLPPDSLPGLRSWTSLGDFRPPEPQSSFISPQQSCKIDALAYSMHLMPFAHISSSLLCSVCCLSPDCSLRTEGPKFSDRLSWYGSAFLDQVLMRSPCTCIRFFSPPPRIKAIANCYRMWRNHSLSLRELET